MSSGYFIDWLTMEQSFDYELPRISDKEAIYIETATGCPVGSRVFPVKHAGSYSTFLQVSCDGFRVRVDGNPSRFGRLDNLFGLRTFDECVAVYNEVLHGLGLPGFTKTTRVDYLTGVEGSSVKAVSDGAVIRRVDFTKNYIVGHGNEKTFLSALSTQSIRRKVPNLYPNGQTVTFHDSGSFGRSHNGSRHVYHKVYNKGHEMRLFEKSKKFQKLSLSEKEYFNRVLRFVEGKGLVREEKEFKGKWLDDKRLQYYGMIRESDFDEYLGEVEDIMKRLSVNAEFSDVAGALLKEGVCKSKQAAYSTERIFQLWAQGQPLERNSQWYVHRKRLQQIGIDISIALDLTRKLPNVRCGREIDFAVAHPPRWYRSAGRQHLSLVQ